MNEYNPSVMGASIRFDDPNQNLLLEVGQCSTDYLIEKPIIGTDKCEGVVVANLDKQGAVDILVRQIRPVQRELLRTNQASFNRSTVRDLIEQAYIYTPKEKWTSVEPM